MSQILAPVFVPDNEIERCHPEEFTPMTLQIAILANDGWVLASERRAGEQRNQMGRADRSFGVVLSAAKKLWHLPNEKATLCCSGGDAARRVTELLVSKLTSNQFDRSKIGVELRQAVVDLAAHSNTTYGSDRILAVFYHSARSPQLWCLDIAGGVSAFEFNTWTISGDWGNAAKLFPQLYYSPRSISSLTELAIFTLEFGHCSPSAQVGQFKAIE